MKPIHISLTINDKVYQLAGERPEENLGSIDASQASSALDAFKQLMRTQLYSGHATKLADEFWVEHVEVRIANGTICYLKQLDPDLLFAEWLLVFHCLDHIDGEPI